MARGVVLSKNVLAIETVAPSVFLLYRYVQKFGILNFYEVHFNCIWLWNSTQKNKNAFTVISQFLFVLNPIMDDLKKIIYIFHDSW